MNETAITLPELTHTPKNLGDCRAYVRSVIDANAEGIRRAGVVYAGQSGLTEGDLDERLRACVRAGLDKLMAHIKEIPEGHEHGLAVAGFLSDVVLSSPQLLRENLVEGTLAQRAYSALSRHLHDVAGRRANELLDAAEAKPGTAMTYTECAAHARKLVRAAHAEYQEKKDADKPFAAACMPDAVANNTIAELRIGRDESVSVLRSEPTLWTDAPAGIMSSVGLSILKVIEARLACVAEEEIRACDPQGAAESMPVGEPAPGP